jgi:curved DNA-binding protein
MIAPTPSMTAAQARQMLGLGALAEAGDVRLAFREAAKAAHPDRGGDPERFRAVVEAYRALQGQRPPERLFQPPAVAREEDAETLSISPLLALQGGSLEHRLADGRRAKLTLPAGLRTGDRVRAAGARLTVAIRRDGETLVRGDDIWITVDLEPRRLAEGGRIALETPLGRRLVWVTRKAGERGLVRVVGQGLPARGAHPAGHLFLRLKPLSRTTDSAARTLLRRFAAAWAA